MLHENLRRKDERIIVQSISQFIESNDFFKNVFVWIVLAGVL